MADPTVEPIVDQMTRLKIKLLEKEQQMLDDLARPHTWAGTRRQHYYESSPPPVYIYQSPPPVPPPAPFLAPPPAPQPPRIIQHTVPHPPATIIQQLPQQQPLITQIPPIQPAPHRSGSIKEDMVELMLMQNAQMHQIIMHNMMLKALPPTAAGTIGSPPVRFQDNSMKAKGAVHHHHHYGPPPLPPIGYSAWPSMMLPQRGGAYQPSVHHITSPVSLPPLNTILAVSGRRGTESSWWFVMYEWIVDGLSSLFVPFSVFSGGNSPSWPTDANQPPPSRDAVTSKTQQENYRLPAKRNYQSVHSPDGVLEQLESKRPRRDVIVRVVKKTFAGIAGLLRLRQHKQRRYENERDCKETQIRHVSLVGIDEIHSNGLSNWTTGCDVKMEKQREMGLSGKERTLSNFCVGSQALIRKPESRSVLFMGNPDRQRELPHRRSLHLLPSRPVLPDVDHPGRAHKPCLAVEEALKESDREHYRKLVEMVSEKYSKNKPLPFGRVQPSITPFPHSRTTPEISKPTPIKVNPHAPVWRSSTLSNHVKESDVGRKKPDQPPNQNRPFDVDLSVEVETRLNLKDRETAAVCKHSSQSRSEPVYDKGKHLDEEFPRLTKVSAALAHRDPDLILSSAFKLRITQRDLATLQEGCWLNDEVINFYLNLVMSRTERETGGRKVHCFNTFFFPKLHRGGHAAVRRWTKAVDLFVYDVILIPLHLGVHWSLAVIDFRTQSVRSYDSMGQRHEDICNLILMYIKEEYEVKKGKDLEILKWTCHMPYFRKLMIWEILTQKLLQ
ncbi:Sentrin-specific protease 2 [Bagarius yarrelli]|uniref:Sentrin-specific protease 2 n=1 Tax=Bagarius yarrelli TaxID=175774 RepID=A0A556VBL3_BAGYA|nr:Sentrin-specific protease 2 [Bagarius yarrelli]